MKSLIKYFLLFVISASLFNSCKKDIEDGRIIAKEDFTNIGNSIVIGDTTNMIVKTYNHNLVFSPIPINNVKIDFAIDLDNNGTNDIQFINESVPLYQQNVNYYFLSLKSTNPQCTFLGTLKTDTTFYREDTTNNFIHRLYSCYRLSVLDIVLYTNPNQLKINPLASGYVLSKSESFNQDPDSVPIFWQDRYVLPQLLGSYNVTSSYQNDCDLFALDNFYYVGIKLIDNSGTEKLGWIYFYLKYWGNLEIIESVIQQ